MADQPETDARSSAWIALADHKAKLSTHTIKGMFASGEDRLAWACAQAGGISLDVSKNQLSGQTLQLLAALATERDLAGWQKRMAAGEAINATEGRAVLHMALRGGLPRTDAAKLAADSKARFLDFATKVQAGDIRSSTSKPFRTVVNIGIGGSDLGPRLAVDALHSFGQTGIAVRFVANVDGAELTRALKGVDAETTLFIVSSKTFTTQETIENAKSARAWLVANLPKGGDPSMHFVGVTANMPAANSFGISPDHIFPIWDWVGGRFSVWSAVGLSLALAIGTSGFEEFLAGAAEIDRHFMSAPFSQNVPVLLALVGLWNRDFLDLRSHAVLPYAHALSLLPGYLQQLEMESNGKRVQRGGHRTEVPTAPAVWGGAGTTGQHAFYQWLHQGTDCASADIILPLSANEGPQHHHDILVSHAIAQAEALALGRDEAATRAELTREGLSPSEVERLLPHRIFPGNRPVSVLTFDRLTPRRLGALLTIYEHKVFTQGILWNINSFDQWGVELGKTAAGRVLDALRDGGDLSGFDPATRKLIKAAQAARAKDKNET